VLNALQSNAAVNIVSTPNILTMDNEEAKIVVGRNVPFPVGQTQTSFGVPLINFQREDVAITLKVTPQINESDYVTLETFLEIQEIEGDIAGTAASGGPTTSKRSVENTIVVKDNQTIVVGGLIAETDNETETKIPILGDIPLIGALFRGKTNQSRKTNLMIFLTPHIIDEPVDLEEIYRVKWAQRQEFIKRFYGKSRDEQEAEMAQLMSYSFNQIDQPSKYRGPSTTSGKYQVVGEQAPANPVDTGATDGEPIDDGEQDDTPPVDTTSPTP
jgi:general secretion pathway protein D